MTVAKGSGGLATLVQQKLFWAQIVKTLLDSTA